MKTDNIYYQCNSKEKKTETFPWTCCYLWYIALAIIILAYSCRYTGMQPFRASIIPVLVSKFHQHMYYIFFKWTCKWNSTNLNIYKSIVPGIDYTYNRFGALLNTIWLKLSFSWVDPKAHNSLALLAFFSKRSSSALRRMGHNNGFPYGRFFGL